MTVSRVSPRKTAKKRGGRKVPVRAVAKPAASRSKELIAVTAEQRRRLIEDAAYFRAERYRCVGPGNFREEDRCRAETEIEAVISRGKRR